MELQVDGYFIKIVESEAEAKEYLVKAGLEAKVFEVSKTEIYVETTRK